MKRKGANAVGHIQGIIILSEADVGLLLPWLLALAAVPQLSGRSVGQTVSP